MSGVFCWTHQGSAEIPELWVSNCQAAGGITRKELWPPRSDCFQVLNLLVQVAEIGHYGAREDSHYRVRSHLGTALPFPKQAGQAGIAELSLWLQGCLT